MAEVLPPNTAEEWKSSGNEFYKVKNYASAISSYSKAIEMDPSNALYYTNRAAAYLMTLQYRDAQTDCDQAIKLDAACAKAYFRKATALKGLGLLDQAIDALTRGLEHEPSSSTAGQDREALINCKSKIERIRDLVTDKRYSMALTQVDALIREVGSSFPELILLRAQCLLCSQRPEEAFNFTNALLKNPTLNYSSDPTLLHLRAQCLFSMGDLDNSLKHLQQAMRADPDNATVRTYYRHIKDVVERKAQGDQDFKHGQYGPAGENYRGCIDTALKLPHLNNNYLAKLFLNKATSLHKLKKHEEAIKDCNKALYYNKQYVKAMVRRGDCYLAMGGETHIASAIRDYEAAKEMEAEDSEQANSLDQKLKKAKVMLKRAKRKDLYAVLGVTAEASETEIKAAYRKAALKYHPDKQASKCETERAEAEAKFKDIGEAYEVLTNPEKKARYDEGVELEDLDNPHAGGGMDSEGMDQSMLFQMFMQQQRQQQQRGGGGGGRGFY